ncbi:DOT1-domain-containing protein [Rhizopogon salebrosus TDB-379]|nr:DOT1-domain-containing protein [Rhizopogon salebrosus TDB-379]
MVPEICVTTRHAWKAQMKREQEAAGSQAHLPPPTPVSAETSPETDEPDHWIAGPSKRPRILSTTPDSTLRSLKPKKRANACRSRASSSRAQSRQRSETLDVEPIYRNSRSRSTSVLPPTPRHRQFWITEDGSPGENFVSAASVIKKLSRSYKTYFKNLDDPSDTSFEAESYPATELEYPNAHACETYYLLAPRDPDHYNPIMCLEQSLYTIFECYLTPTQQALFGTLPTDFLQDTDITPPSSPLTQESDQSSPLKLPSYDPRGTNYLRLLQRSIRRRDGPLFLSTMQTINQLLRSLKYPPLPSDVFAPAPPNVLLESIKSWPQSEIPNKVLMRIIDETYQRSVGPHALKLNRYEAFSSEVYGELMPSFTSDIIAATGLHKDSLFMDLGCGVGNVLVQASLETCCRSYGIEVMPTPAEVGREQLRQMKKRCRMWGLSMGEVELEEGDMLTSRRVTELLPQADVVLVNNKVFQQPLNEALRPRFLDLKEGAIVVSLKPFVSSLNARVTERNVDDISAIFDVAERPYHSGSVSWGSGGGSYYLHKVDREGYASIKQRFENLRARSARASRR